MCDKLLEKLPIFVRLTRQCKSVFVVVVILTLIGCAGAPVVDQPDSTADFPADSTDNLPANNVETAAQPDDQGLDSEFLFHVLAAERLGAVGDFEDALGHYLEAARLSDDPELAQRVVSLAMRLGEWPAMAEGAARWYELDPSDPAAGQFRVLGLMNMGEYAAAADQLAGWIRQSDDKSEGWREAVVLIAAADQEEDALAVMAALVERAADSARTPQVLESRSFLMWQLGRTDEALVLALDAAEQGGEKDHRVWAAQLAAAASEMDLALDLYRQARADAPDDRGLALAEAEVLRQMDRTDDAIDLLAAMPPGSEVLYTLGSYLYQAGRMEEAEDAWDQLAAVDDVDDAMHHAFLVAFLAELLELDDQALEWYEQVQSGPNVNRALLRRAVIEGQHGNLPAARNLLYAVRLGNEPDLSRQSLIVEADLLRVAGQADIAVRLLTRALREQPGSVALLYSRAICAVAMDDIELAEQDFRRILQIEDDNAMALNALGYTLTDRTDRHQEAYRLIQRALELEPDSPSILDSMGWVYFRLGRPERALPYLEEALEGEDNPEIAAHLGEVLWHLGREAEAIEVLSDAIRRFPDDSYLIDTRQRLGVAE